MQPAGVEEVSQFGAVQERGNRVRGNLPKAQLFEMPKNSSSR